MADLLGRLKVEIVGDNTKLEKSIDQSKKSTEKFASNTEKLGKSLGALFTGIAFTAVATKLFNLGKQAENLFKVQELAETKLDQTLVATGNAAGLTADQLKTMASELQDVTTIGDEATIGAQSLLLTFKNIGEDVFPRALESILDVSTGMGQDLKTSSIQLGKALNDPITGLTALQRVGITFTEQQKEQIKAFQESGDLASAQGIILTELESQFGGLARAVAETADGVEKQLNNAYGDLLETIGSVIAEGMTPFRKSLKDEIVSVNESITAHILRQKALRGESTLVENLTIKQIELKKKTEELAQANANIEAAENQVLNTRGLSEIQIIQITAAKAAAIEKAKELVTTLEGERESLERQVSAVEQQVIAERNALQANVNLATGIQTVTDTTDDNTESTEENTEAHRLNFEEYQKNTQTYLELVESRNLIEAESLDNRTANEISYTEFVKEQEEERAEAAIEAEKKKTAARQAALESITSILSTIDTVGDAFADAEIARLEEQGATEEEIEEKKKQLARENAIRERASGLFSIAVSTPQAIAKALTAGPIAGPILAAIIGGLAAVQLGALLAAPLPRFATGGIVGGGQFSGDRQIARVNAGEMVLNRSQQAELFRMANGQTTNNNGTININNMFSLGNETQIREAARRLFPEIIKEGQRRGVAIGA